MLQQGENDEIIRAATHLLIYGNNKNRMQSLKKKNSYA